MKKFLLTWIAGFTLTISVGQAAIVTTFVGTSAGPTGTYFNYDLDINRDTTVRPGDYAVIYDFGPVLSLLSPDSNWTVTAEQPGPVPADLVSSVNDGPAFNIKFTYVGLTNLVGPQYTGNNDLTFSIESPSSIAVVRPKNESSSFLETATNLPGVSRTNEFVPEPVPEPATMGLMGGALAGLGFLARRRK